MYVNHISIYRRVVIVGNSIAPRNSIDLKQRWEEKTCDCGDVLYYAESMFSSIYICVIVIVTLWD